MAPKERKVVDVGVGAYSTHQHAAPTPRGCGGAAVGQAPAQTLPLNMVSAHVVTCL